MKMKHGVMAAALMAVACAMQAQVVVKHLQPNEKSPIANGVWAGDTLYLSGQLASPVTPADAAKGTAAVYGDTKTQALSALNKIQASVEGAGAGYEGRREDDGVSCGRSGEGQQAGFCRDCRRRIRSSSGRRTSRISRRGVRCR